MRSKINDITCEQKCLSFVGWEKIIASVERHTVIIQEHVAY